MGKGKNPLLIHLKTKQGAYTYRPSLNACIILLRNKMTEKRQHYPRHKKWMLIMSLKGRGFLYVLSLVRPPWTTTVNKQEGREEEGRGENLSPAMRRGIDSRNRLWNWVAKLHRLAGRYDNPMPTWFLVPIAGLKLPTQSFVVKRRPS